MTRENRPWATMALSAIASLAVADPDDERPVDNEQRLLGDVRQLTFEGRRAGEGYFSADGNRMIFQSERDPANPFYQIHLLDLETGDVDLISPGHGKTTCAWIHPQEDRVLYASTHADAEAHQKMQAELDFRASGQQRRYSWDYDEQYEIFTQALDGSGPVNLTNALGYDAEGAYSPDGSQIVFASNRRAYSGEMTAVEAKIFEHDKSFMMDIYIMNADGSDVRRLTDSAGYDGGPFFSADGRHITWRRFSADGSRAEIFTKDLATGEEKQLTRMGVMSWAPYFHPSGDYLIFASNREGFANFELFIVDAQGQRDPVRVTTTAGFDGLPVFTPDGERLSWTSNRTANRQSQIFWAAWDDSEARRLLGMDATAEFELASSMQVALPATAAAIRAEDARAHVERLTDEEMAGRLTGTDGERKATAYVARVFEQIGLQPAGEDGGWFQTFPFTSGASLGAANTLQWNGVSDAADPKLDANWRPLAMSRNGQADAAGIAFAGYGIVAPGAGEVPDYDAYGELDVAGKWVMVLRFLPESVPPAWRRHLLHYSELPYKAAVAKQRGAVGLIVVTGPEAEARERLVPLDIEGGSGSTSIAAVSVSDDFAQNLLVSSGKDLGALQKALDEGAAGEGFVLGGVEMSAQIDVIREKADGRNVIARLPASDPQGLPPVIIGAHVDHLGRGQGSGSLAGETERGAIHPGADDNASGIAAMLEIAQYLVALEQNGKLGSKRDILFAAWSGEELGTLGSGYFAEQFASGSDLAGKVSAYLNLDMVGRLDEKLYLQGTGSSPVWAREIERRNVPVGLSIATKSDPYLPTDATPFYLKKVPVLNAFTGAHEDYSTPRDTADRLNYDGLSDTARLFAGIARSLARTEGEPEYVAVERKGSGMSRRHLRAYLGTIPAYGQDEQVKGVKLQGAIKGGPAEAAGIQSGDLLVGLAGIDVDNIQDFMSALGGLKAGEPTEIVVIREGQRVVLPVVPGTRE